MNAKDIMTTPVSTVTPTTLVSEVARLLFERHISALPVMDDGRLVGIVSEADLLRRHEIGTDCAFREDPWWMRFIATSRLPGEYVRSHARYARDIMTEKVVTVSPGTTLSRIASLFEKHGIKRLPVLDKGRLVGILSRSDLVRALAESFASDAVGPSLPDAAIQSRLLAELQSQAWWQPGLSMVNVKDGVVTYSGFSEIDEERAAARVAAENIPGVRGVVDRRLPYIAYA